MKLKCDDGKVRRFQVTKCDGDYLSDGTRQNGDIESACLECGEEFGFHDTKILKPWFKSHVCEKGN